MAAFSTEDPEMTSSFSDEERNFLKFANLVICQCPKAVRVCFDSEFHPSVLKTELTRNYATLQDLQRKRVITKDQMNLLFPSGGGNPSSESFDISLMTALLRHVANLPITDGPPVIKAGSMKPEYAVSAIKYYRNQIAHSNSGKLSNNEFTVQFDIVIQAIDTLCPSMTPCCEKIRTADLSPSIVELLKETLKHEHEIQELRENQNAQQAEIEKLKTSKDGDYIRLNYWEEKDDLYVEPGVFTDMYETARNKYSLLITGVSGIGKTMSARHLALKLRKDHDFIPTPCDSLSDVVSRYRENTLQTFVIDDVCGKYNLSMENVERLLKAEDDIAAILDKKKTNIITTCRLDIFNEEAFPKSVSIFQSVINLSEKYSDEDKIRIASKYLNASDKSHLMRIVSNATFSPLICSMYSKSEEFRIEEYLDRPFEIMCKELDRMKSFNKLKYCLLMLCVLQNGTIDVKLLTEGQHFQEMIACVFEVCRLGRDTSRYELLDMAEASIGTYLTKDGFLFKVIHDKIFDFLCGYFGEKMFSTIIKFADTKLLCERTVLRTFTDNTPHSFAIVVPDGSKDQLFNRMKSDIIQNQKVQEWMGHLQKSEEAFRSILDTYVEKIDDSKLSKVLESINKSGLNPFTASCLNGYEDLVSFFIIHGADVNAVNGWFTPLTAACREGQIEIVNMLITAGASVNKTGHFGETPLHVASIRGFIDIARVLVDNQANLHETNKYGQSPLYSSMMAGQNEMISYLIGKGALLNIDKIDKRDLYTLANDLNVPHSIGAVCSEENTLVNEVFLLMAAAYGNVDLIEQIIKIGPIDINYVNEDGDTSLHIASSRDFLKVAEVLLSNGAEVDMVNKKGETPLHLACKNDQGEIVKLLIQNNALTSIRNKNNRSPHDIAFFHDRKHIMTTLESLNVRQSSSFVDMRKIQDFFIPPFYKEILLNNFDVAKQMIKTGACVNIKTEDGDVPLAVACECGYGSIIQLLIENDADIKEAFHVAMIKMYSRAVRILMSKYPKLIYESFGDGSTPLIIACKKGNVDILLSLLKASNDLDINMLSKEGITALYVACESTLPEPTFVNVQIGADVKQVRPLNIDRDKCVSQLISFGADVNQTVTLACRNMNARVIRLLHRRQLSTININHLNNMDKLYFACVVDDVKTLCAVIKDRVGVNQTFSDGSTPLIISFTNGSMSVVEFLLEHKNHFKDNRFVCQCFLFGEDVNQTVELAPPFLFGEDVNQTVKLAKLFSFGEDVNQREKLDCINMITRAIRRLLHRSKKNINHLNYKEKIYFACVIDDVKTLIEVIQHKVNVNQTFPDGSTPLIVSCENGSTFCALRLLDVCDVNINLSNNEGETALHMACKTGANNQVVSRLIRNGANINQACSDGSTPLMIACRNKNVNAVKLLLEWRNANINHSNNEGKTALHMACKSNECGYIVSELICKGANINQTCSDGSTPLILACKNGSDLVVDILLAYNDRFNVDINLSNNEGKTALYIACEKHLDKVASQLIFKGADVNQTCLDGSTPLIQACRNRNVGAVRVLLRSRNVNINHLNNEGKTALQIASETHCDEIVELLREASKQYLSN